MLMGYARVSAQGDYTPPPPGYAKAAYATLIKTRADIVRDAGWALARATTIAVRQPRHAAAAAVSPADVFATLFELWVQVASKSHFALLALYLCIFQ